jgi:hypothetical protein
MCETGRTSVGSQAARTLATPVPMVATRPYGAAMLPKLKDTLRRDADPSMEGLKEYGTQSNQ